MSDLQKAVEILQRGGLVAIPTETVYGLAADAKNPEAIKRIFQAKGRPSDHPLIVHLGDISQLNDWALDISDQAMQLAKTFWPGPLTIIFKKAPHVSNLLTGDQDTIGIRMPNHPLTLSLLKLFGSGVAAPSANRFGRISPTTAAAVKEELGDRVDLILDGGQCEVGVESTIIDMSGEHPRILRPGMITAEQIEKVLHQHLSSKKNNAPRVSGSLESHYAPVTKTVLMSTSEIEKCFHETKQSIFIVYSLLPECSLRWESREGGIEKNYYFLMPNNPHQYAHDLYQTLRDLDKQHFQQIIIEKMPETAEWTAIRDRLQRAAN